MNVSLCQQDDGAPLVQLGQGATPDLLVSPPTHTQLHCRCMPCATTAVRASWLARAACSGSAACPACPAMHALLGRAAVTTAPHARHPTAPQVGFGLIWDCEKKKGGVFFSTSASACECLSRLSCTG